MKNEIVQLAGYNELWIKLKSWGKTKIMHKF